MAAELILLFDGDCSLCNRTVRFITKHSPANTFCFLSQQSTEGMAILNKYHIQSDSIVLVENGLPFLKSQAVSRIATHLNKPYPTLSKWEKYLPLQLKDWLYDLVAKNRKRFFKQTDSCKL